MLSTVARGMMAWIVSAFLLFGKMMVTQAGSCFQDTLKLDLVTEWQSQCFGFKDSLYTWSEAARACQRMDANLIRMTGPEVQVMMADKIAKMHSGRHEIVSFWLGARDEKKTNEWRWENNDALEWTSWTAGPHSGTCVIYDGYLAGWRKTNCESFDATVCQKGQLY
ncbi:perlucin-like protein [Liolophura sinensis]|uniref:perlucin-like protein n=1 Tax=Liolophura sinensis TaxID=3198878 RepID=UPI00315954E7